MNFTEAFNAVIEQIPRCPEFVISNSFNRVCRRFCEETEALRAVVTISVVATQQTYTYTPPLTDTITQKIYSAVLTEGTTTKTLKAATTKWLANELSSKFYDPGSPRYYVHSYSDSIDLYPIPNLSLPNALRLETSFKPKRNATSIDDTFAERFFESLVMGTVAEIARKPDTEFYNPDLFPIAEGYFLEGIRKAKEEAQGQDRNVPRKVKYGGL